MEMQIIGVAFILIAMWTFIHDRKRDNTAKRLDDLIEDLDKRDSYEWLTDTLIKCGIFPCSGCGNLFRYLKPFIYDATTEHYCARCTEHNNKEVDDGK